MNERANVETDTSIPLPDDLLGRLAAMPASITPCPGFRTGEWEDMRRRAIVFLHAQEAEATALGWRDIDLLGVHPVVGITRVDYTGALLLGFYPVASITAEAITYANGLKFLRSSVPEDAVPIWEFAALNAKDTEP
jgi:hypothetical protein